MNYPNHLAVTGRIDSWHKNPESRLPVSCTTYSVEDSMESDSGIEDSWLFTSKALRGSAGVAINLSSIRPRGTDNGKGLVASGPCSFAQLYSKLNEILRRGGQFRNGAVTLYLDYNHDDVEEYLNLSPSEIPWAKRALYVDDNLFESSFIDLIIQRVRDGSIWLAKKQYDKSGERLYSNVCLEILLKHRATCLLSHVNLGSTTIAEIPNAFVEGMKFLCEMHGKTGVDDSGIYLPSNQDKQVGLGVIGLSNLLAIEKVSYADFVEALEAVLDWDMVKPEKRIYSKADAIAIALLQGFHEAAVVAAGYNMDRAFTIAPTATCSYRYTDREGYTTSPEISPPNCNPITKEVIRESETFGNIPYEYHPDCETASEIDWDIQYRLMKAWQRLMDTTGLAHSISFNIWDKAKIDHAFIKDWLGSPLKTTYYTIRTRQDSLDKSQIASCDLSGVCTSCSE